MNHPIQTANGASYGDAWREMHMLRDDNARPTGARGAVEVFASIPREEWIDFGYMLMVPAVLTVALPLLILWCRP